MLSRLLQLATFTLALALFAGCGSDDAPAKDADAGPQDATYIEGPTTSKIHDLNPYLEQWIPFADAAADATDLAAEAGEQQ